MHNFRFIHNQVHLPDCCAMEITRCSDCILEFQASSKAFPCIFVSVLVCFSFCYFSLCSVFPLQSQRALARTKSLPVIQITYKATFFNTLFCQQGWISICVVVSNDTATNQTFVLVVRCKQFYTTPALASPSWPHCGKMATESLSRTPAPSLTCC